MVRGVAVPVLLYTTISNWSLASRGYARLTEDVLIVVLYGEEAANELAADPVNTSRPFTLTARNLVAAAVAGKEAFTWYKPAVAAVNTPVVVFIWLLIFNNEFSKATVLPLV